MGAKEKYPPMEKLAYALITVACKPMPYFQAHIIVVQTDKPLRKTMNNPKAAGKLVLWVIELSEFNIQYRLRTAIKAQALANFIAKFTKGKTNDWGAAPWRVRADRSFNKHAGRIRVVLQSP